MIENESKRHFKQNVESGQLRSTPFIRILRQNAAPYSVTAEIIAELIVSNYRLQSTHSMLHFYLAQLKFGKSPEKGI